MLQITHRYSLVCLAYFLGILSVSVFVRVSKLFPPLHKTLLKVFIKNPPSITHAILSVLSNKYRAKSFVRGTCTSCRYTQTHRYRWPTYHHIPQREGRHRGRSEEFNLGLVTLTNSGTYGCIFNAPHWHWEYKNNSEKCPLIVTVYKGNIYKNHKRCKNDNKRNAWETSVYLGMMWFIFFLSILLLNTMFHLLGYRQCSTEINMHV